MRTPGIGETNFGGPVVVCPFCGRVYPTVAEHCGSVGTAGELTILSIECTCGATYALTRGGRPHARSD